MKTILTVAIIAAALAAAAAWAIAGPRPAGSAYRVEVRDVAGVSMLTVVPEVVSAAPAEGVMPEVVVHAQDALGVVVMPRPGLELVN